MPSEKLRISEQRLREVNDFLMKPDNKVVEDLLAVVEKYGGVEEINRKGAEAGKLESLLAMAEERKLPHMDGLNWLQDQRDNDAFITIDAYRKKVLGDRFGSVDFDDSLAVTLEISSLQFFPFLIEQAKRSIDRGELMPGRYIRVRCMKEQEEDGDLIATQAAMKIVGATVCETLDTKGTDGSNIHLGGPATITGYFGGVGQPNDHAIQWIDEFLHYYTSYGVRQVLNINPGTVMLGYLLHKLGVDIEFKISVFMGNDNPYAVFWTLMAARLLSREDGSTPLIGFNYSNSVDNSTVLASSMIREGLGLSGNVRFEHHITEAYKSIVLQPYDRRAELLDVADRVPNISAKHEGGLPTTEEKREHPSDILDYFVPKRDIEEQGTMRAMLQNYLDKHEALNSSAWKLTERGFSVIPAWNLHK